MQQRISKSCCDGEEEAKAGKPSAKAAAVEPTRLPTWSHAVGPQAKLTVNQPGDAYEQEADRVAEQVTTACDAAEPMPTGAPAVSPAASPVAGPTVQTKPADASGGPPAPPVVHQALQSPGQPLDPATRHALEPRLGQDFGDVRVHTDPMAAQSANAVHARAYTVGRDVVFAEGQYAPHTAEGQRLLAHELAHVVQQSRATAHPHSQRLFRQSHPTPGQGETDKEPIATAGDSQPAIPADWPQHVPITWGSVGMDVHYLRVRLNQVLVGRHAALALDPDPRQARFSKADADAVQAFQRAINIVKPGGFIQGGGAVGVASARTIELLRSSQAEPDPEYLELLKVRQPLIDGALADSGDYDATKGFTNPTLQKVLVYYSKHWAATDWRLATGDRSAAPVAQAGGDLSAKWVKDFPLWVNVFQDKLINSPTWGPDEEAVRALLTTFLRAHTKVALGGKLPATVAEFLEHVGKSELNRQSEDLVRGSIGNSVWCAQASSEALVRALQDAGLQPIPGPWQKHPERLYMTWLTSTIKKRRVDVIGPPTSYQVSLQPGDRITVVSKSSPLTGHVATVVQDQGKSIRLVSGNAGGGEGSIRVDEVTREDPPKSYDYGKVVDVYNEKAKVEKEEKELAGQFHWEPTELTEVPENWHKPSKEVEAWTRASKRLQELTTREIPKLEAGYNKPKQAGVVWVVEVVRTNELDAAQLANASDEELATLGLQRRTPKPAAQK